MAFGAYDNGYPQIYYPNQQPMQSMQYIRPQPQPQPTQQPQQGGVIWVQGEEGAKAYMVAAGNSVLLMDSESPRFYIKSTDQSGMPLPLRIFDYTERQQAAPNTPPQAAQPAQQYVTRAEFDALIARINQLTPTIKEESADA